MDEKINEKIDKKMDEKKEVERDSNIFFQTPAQIPESGIKTIKNGLKFIVTTKKLSPLEMTKMFSLAGKPIYVALAEGMIQDSDIDLPEFIENLEKSPSRRLREIMYIYFCKRGGDEYGFQKYYERYMNSLIERFKDKVDEINKK
jgi:hypothetical protein